LLYYGVHCKSVLKQFCFKRVNVKFLGEEQARGEEGRLT
jgi:hypothetical protein